jgi:hypothetical protein
MYMKLTHCIVHWDGLTVKMQTSLGQNASLRSRLQWISHLFSGASSNEPQVMVIEETGSPRHLLDLRFRRFKLFKEISLYREPILSSTFQSCCSRLQRDGSAHEAVV